MWKFWTKSLPQTPHECVYKVWTQGLWKWIWSMKNVFKYFFALQEKNNKRRKKLFCETLYCICWALAHIVHVVGTSSKQSLVHDWRMDTCWRGTGGKSLGKKEPPHKGFHMHKIYWFKFSLTIWVLIQYLQKILCYI